MRVVKKLPAAAKPDGSTYAEPFHKLYVSDERGHAVAVVDVREDKIITTLHFDSSMEHNDPKQPDEPTENTPAWREVFLYYLMLGFINIGGRVAQLTMMFNHMVERRAWLSKERFVSIMGFCHM